MKQFIRPFLFLIGVCAILLLSDLQNRKGGSRAVGKTRDCDFQV